MTTPWDGLIGGALVAEEDPAAPRLALYRPVGALPSEAECVLSSPQYQRRANSCLPHAGAFALESEAKGRTGAVVQVSIMDCYYGYRVLAGDYPRDVGSYPHKMEEWHGNHGTITADLAPYDDSTVTTWKPKVEWAGERRLLRSDFEKMPPVIEQIEAEIAAKRPVVVCHNVDRQMTNEAATTGLERGMTGPSLGGHGRCIVSYRRSTGRAGIINWWERWGLPCPWDSRFRDSYSEVPYEVLIDPRWSFDFRRIKRGLQVET